MHGDGSPGLRIAIPPPAPPHARRRRALLRAALRAEDCRVRAHLRAAERALRARPLETLPPDLRRARLAALDLLGAYHRRGAFPRNTDFPGRSAPYLRDRRGTACAVAFILDHTGAGAAVDALAARDNHVRVAQAGPDLAALVEARGLTLAEAARIQPSYDCVGDASPIEVCRDLIIIDSPPQGPSSAVPAPGADLATMASADPAGAAVGIALCVWVIVKLPLALMGIYLRGEWATLRARRAGRADPASEAPGQPAAHP